MKRRTAFARTAALCFFLASALFAMSLHASAYSYGDAAKELDAAIPDDIIEKLPEKVRESLDSDGEDFDPAAIATSIDGKFVLNKLIDAAKEAVPDVVGDTAAILGVVMVCALMRAMRADSSDGISSALDAVCVLCTVMILYSRTSSLWKTINACVISITTLMNALAPTMTVLLASGGNVTTSTVTAGGLALGTTLVENICTYVMYPFLRISFGLTLVSGFEKCADLSGLISLFKNIFTWLLGLASLVLSTVLGYQTTVAAASDNMLLRTMKFASSGSIPIVGGALSDAAGSIVGSMSLIRSSAGMIAAVSVALVALPVLIKILLYRATLKLTATLARTVGCDRERGFLEAASETCGFGLALVCVCAVMFLFMLAIFSKTAAGGAV